MNADEAYLNQEEHPDLAVVACDVCGQFHLNDPLERPPLCPDCVMEETNGP